MGKIDDPSPVSLAGHVSFIHNGHAVSTGGVNENIFNGYFSDVELSKGIPR
ncbi:hypothetical protein MUTS16_69190 [Escherichia coli]|nr:hypothetical protein MUTS16_69190 [Escherichia coli]